MFTQNVLDGIRVYSLTFDTVAENVAINVKSWSIVALKVVVIASHPFSLVPCVQGVHVHTKYHGLYCVYKCMNNQRTTYPL